MWQQKQKKYLQGRRLPNVEAVLRELRRGNYVMFHGKAMHPAVLGNWSIWNIENCAQHKAMHATKLNPKYVAPERRWPF